MARFLMLDRMEINGFKSFYGRTRFEFPQGITAVVGPNGCGKSNIGDAISWVLGEQRASSLRSDRMEDVIFNGSDARRPLGMAEVSLFFKNVAPVVEPGGNGRGNGHGHLEAGSRFEEGAAPEEAPFEGEPPSEMGAPDEPASPGRATAAEAEVPIPVAQEAEEPRPPGARFYLEEIPDEVVVTRRLYRSGESEYILNGQRCRLKDVQDLLSRTQVGTRLYSTIEQGKIEQILASKPRDRRAMFEEAAGILGYKTRRRQAEIKLEAAQANLLRISDIGSEVERQIGSLKRQAAKARRYRRLLEGLRERRGLIAHRRLLVFDEDRRATLEALAGLKVREAQAAAERARDEAALEDLRRRLEEGEEAARLRREAIHALDIQIDRLQGQILAAGEQARDRTGRIGEVAGEIDGLLARERDLRERAQILESETEADAARVQEAAARLDRIEAEHRERALAIAGREAALEEARAELMRHLDALGALGLRGAALEEQGRSARVALERVESERAEAEASRATLAAALAALESRTGEDRARLVDLARRREDLREQAREAGERVAAHERRAEEMKGRSAALAERVAALQEMERQHAGFAEGVASILRGAAGFRPAGVVGEGLQVPRDLTRAVEAALGDLLEGIMVSAPDEAVRGVAHLRRGALGRASFVGLPGAAPRAPGVDGVRPAPPVEFPGGRAGVLGALGERVSGAAEGGAVRAILAGTILVADLPLAIALHAAHPGWAFVTPEGDLVRPEGTIRGGDGPESQHGLLARRAEREEIDRQLAEAAAERDAAEARLEAERRSLKSVLEALGAAESACQEEEKTTLEFTLALERRRGDLQRLEATLPLLLSEAERLRADITARGTDSGALAGEAAAAEARRRAMEEAIRTAGEDLAALRSAIEGVRREAAEVTAVVAAGRQRLQALAREKEALDEAAREVAATAARRGAEREEWSAQVATLAGQAAALRRDLERALAERAEAAARDETAHAGLAYDRSLLHAREQGLKDQRTAHAALREELQSRELHLARLESDLDHLASTCRDDLGTTLDDLRARPPAAAEGEAQRALPDLEQEVERLKADLDAIGPVNLMAIEQHAELEERFTFLAAQKKDLDDSIESLRETIRIINRRSRERFLAAFEAIQANFARSFTTLFGGGEAELRLEEREEDVLEAGIEIAAQPPGKRLQSLALLSGGEKALTAVALLFALFRYRPSPFCVLDEVDAPLDEANVERFTRLLQQLRDETQFILITHNRKSMEAADLLYGVTMEEPGVSKVLPLRFE